MASESHEAEAAKNLASQQFAMAEVKDAEVQRQIISTTQFTTMAGIHSDKREKFEFVLKAVNDLETEIEGLKKYHDSMSMLSVITRSQLKDIIVRISHAHNASVGANIELLADCDLGGGVNIKNIQQQSEKRIRELEPPQYYQSTSAGSEKKKKSEVGGCCCKSGFKSRCGPQEH